MIQRVGDHYIVREAPLDDPPASDDELPEDILPPPAPFHRVQPWSSNAFLESSSPTVSPYHTRNAIKRFIVANLTQQSNFMSRQTVMLTRQSDQISQLSSPFERTKQQVDQIFHHLQIFSEPLDTFANAQINSWRISLDF